MNKIIWLLFFSIQIAFSQELELNTSAAHAELCVQEFLGNDFSNFKSVDPERILFFKNVIQNRLSVVYEKNSAQDKYPKLSSIPLFNKYNNSVKRDTDFDASTFNVLKYKISFFSNEPQVIRIDNSDYLLVVAPNKK